MADRDNDFCWRIFNLNWIPVAAMGGAIARWALTREPSFCS
jgi:hypothetical protein